MPKMSKPEVVDSCGNGEAAVVRFTAGHLEAVLEIERNSFPDPWTVQMFRDELQEDDRRICLVLEDQSQVAGYLIGWVVLDEFHLGNLAVRLKSRGRGMGRILLKKGLELACQRGCRLATLEVRAGNQPAIELYRSFGFRPVAIRKKYYHDEDALVMLADLDRGGQC